MMPGGKPNHEAAPGARYKLELAQRADAAMKAANP
jgi:hypothetical protein